jgi:hypothetical protein
MAFLEKNLQSLIKVNPVLTAKLHSIESNEEFDVFMDSNDDININIYDKRREYVFYKSKPIDEVTAEYEALMKNYSRHPFMWIYGIANGLLVKMLLNLDKTLFVFEPEIELIYIALNLFDFSKEIAERKLQIYLADELNFHLVNSICSNSDTKTFLKTYRLEVLHSYYFEYYFEDINRINKEFIDGIKNIIQKDGNDANDSLIGLNHHLKHMPAMLDSYPIQKLKNKMNTKTAVIVSTGPSLAKQLPLLKEYQEYVTIFCVDASLPILQSEGIKPDLVFSLERVEATAKFYENLDREFLKETIFMPTSIVHPKTLENIGDMQKAINMRPFGYTKAFHLKEWGYIGLGMSAANMAFDFAYISSVENIVFIGQDLAFAPDGKTHSKGAVYGETEEQYEADMLYIKGYYGGEVKTSKWWHLFLTTFIRDIPKVLEDGKKVYNCTEGGAYIDGAEHIAFAEFLASIEKEKKETIQCSKIPKEKQRYLLKKRKKLIELYMQRLEWVKGEVEKTFLSIMEKIEMLEDLNREDDLEKIDFDTLAETISQIDKIKDLYEGDKILMKMNNITNPFIVNAELELATILVRASDTEIEKKVKMIDWIYEHKSWMFFLAGAIENMIHIYKENYEAIYKDL